MLDTSIAILLRDSDADAKRRLPLLEEPVALSALTVVELEGGVTETSRSREQRRQAVDALLFAFPVLPFGALEAEIYGRIVEVLGFSRPKIIDRMIAAQAIAARAILVTNNVRDFRGIPGLQIETWTDR